MLTQGYVYWYDYWNWLYVVANSLPILIVVENENGHLGFTKQLLTQLASFQTVLLWMMVFYWCRITPELAFYVKMITETFYDIRYFMIMLFICIMMFANGMYVLNRDTANTFK